MKILLINPPQTYFKNSLGFSKGFPLGLAYVAAVIEKEGFKVDILDTLVSKFEIESTGNGEVRYGMSFQNIAAEIEARKPDIVGITCPFTAQFENSVKMAKLIKTINQNTITVVGGPDISVRYRNILSEEDAIDIAVIGEGEHTIINLLKALSNENSQSELHSVSGIAYKKNGDIIINNKVEFITDLDSIPLPAYHLFKMEDYFNSNDNFLYAQRWGRKKREIPIFTSRGCPYNCVFCSIHLHMGRKWRAHSSKYVIDHISQLVTQYNVNHIHFEDDNFTQDVRRVDEILDGIIERKLNITWDTPNGLRADHLNEELLKKMKISGCVGLTIAIESGVQEVLDKIVNKKLDLEKTINIVKTIYEFEIPLHAFFVIGFPGETINDIKKTIKFSLELDDKYNVSSGLFIATPLYGTRLHQICERNGYFTKKLTSRALSESSQGFGIIKTKEFSPQDLNVIINKLHRQKQIIRNKKILGKKLYQYKKYWIFVKPFLKLYYSQPSFIVRKFILKHLLRKQQ